MPYVPNSARRRKKLMQIVRKHKKKKTKIDGCSNENTSEISTTEIARNNYPKMVGNGPEKYDAKTSTSNQKQPASFHAPSPGTLNNDDNMIKSVLQNKTSYQEDLIKNLPEDFKLLLEIQRSDFEEIIKKIAEIKNKEIAELQTENKVINSKIIAMQERLYNREEKAVEIKTNNNSTKDGNLMVKFEDPKSEVFVIQGIQLEEKKIKPEELTFGNEIKDEMDFEEEDTYLPRAEEDDWDGNCEERFLISSDESDNESILSEDESEIDDVEVVSTDWQRESNVPSPVLGKFAFTMHDTAGDVPIIGRAVDYFSLFFTNEIMELIATATNGYAYQKGDHPFTTDANEIRVFLALNMLQGIVKKPAYWYYWTKNQLLETPFFYNCMPRKRFELLRKHLNFSNIATYAESICPFPKLKEIWPVYKILNNNFKFHFSLSRNVSIGECLMVGKGRLSWKQFFRNKKTRLYMMCDSKTGYVWDTIIYTGKGSCLNETYKGLSKPTQIVLTLMDPLLDKGYCVTTDSFYNSPELADKLISRKTDIYGTVKLRRKGMPNELVKREKRIKGKYIAFRKGKIVVMQWNGNKEDGLISTCHTSELIYHKRPSGDILMPRIIKDYNLMEEGIDRVNHSVATYFIKTKSGENYSKEIFFHLLELAVFNAFVLYKKNGQKKDPLGFRLDLINQLIGDCRVTEVRARQRTSTTDTPLRLSERHFPSKYVGTGKTKSPMRMCVLCCRDNATGKRIRRESRFECTECDVGLCAVPCFKLYHTVVDL